MISAICPTRLRPQMLLRMVGSITTSLVDYHDYEIVLRMHSDDAQTISLIPALQRLGPVVVIVGKPLDYTNNRRAFSEALRVSYGGWIWIMNDDVVVSGAGWAKQIDDLSPTHFAVPFTHKSGGATYEKDVGCPFSFYPRKMFQEMHGGLWMSGDTELTEHAVSNGYGLHFIEGLHVWHDWNGQKPPDP